MSGVFAVPTHHTHPTYSYINFRIAKKYLVCVQCPMTLPVLNSIATKMIPLPVIEWGGAGHELVHQDDGLQQEGGMVYMKNQANNICFHFDVSYYLHPFG